MEEIQISMQKVKNYYAGRQGRQGKTPKRIKMLTYYYSCLTAETLLKGFWSTSTAVTIASNSI